MSSWGWDVDEDWEADQPRATDPELVAAWDEALAAGQRDAWPWPFRLLVVIAVVAVPWALIISGLAWIGIL